MNKTLIRAAAVITLVAASITFFACSGEDGSDGTNCRAESVTGGANIICGSQTPVFIADGPGGGGSGSFCTASPLPNGGVVLSCAGADYVIQNTTPGATPDCYAESVDPPPPPSGVTLNGDRVINIRCISDSRSASILVCPVGLNSNQATGLLFNTDGERGWCKADGTIARSAESTLQCGGALFDPKREFCQRTFATNSTATSRDSGFFVEYRANTGLAVAHPYPINDYNKITDPESNYNKAGTLANVKSVVRKLCGISAAESGITNQQIGARHSGGSNTSASGTVFNALQYCGRNLVFKVGGDASANTGNISTSHGGKPIPGGSLDGDAENPSSDAWKVLVNGNCYADLAVTNVSNVNGFTYTGTSTPNSAIALCSFFEAPSVGAQQYTVCPADRPLVALDNVKCVPRSECIFHSTVDNTCLVGKQFGSLFGGTKDSAKVTAATGAAKGDTIASFAHLPTGIYKTKLGSRDGRGTAPTATLQKEGNLWSKQCQTLGRTSYYAVNDPYITNKAWKDGLTASAFTGVGTTAVPIPPPVCGGPNLSDSVITAIPFDDAIVCLQGALSVYYPPTVATNDGSDWNKPVYCVQDNVAWQGASEACYLTSSALNSSTCSRIKGLTPIHPTLPVGVTVTGDWSSSMAECAVSTSGTGSTPITSTNCGNITDITIPKSDPIVAIAGLLANSTVAGANAGNLSMEFGPSGATGKCVIKTATIDPTATVPSPTNLITAASCETAAVGTPGSASYIPAVSHVFKARVIGGNEFDIISSTWNATALGAGSGGCEITANVPLNTHCSQIDLIRTYTTSTEETVPVSAEWR